MNVISIMNDSFCRDRLGCYGNNWIKTSRLDELAGRAFPFAVVRLWERGTKTKD